MFELEEELARKLRHQRVHFDAPDSDTVLLRNVPANDLFFSKPHTNLLIKRPCQGMPYLVCVDEDLDYTGSDPALARVFVAGRKQHGWRVLFASHNVRAGIQQVVEEALDAVGFGGCEPKLKAHAPGGDPERREQILASFATEIRMDAAGAGDEPTIGREEEVEEVVSGLLQWQVCLPVISGESGVGKSNLVREVARKLMRWRPQFKVVSVELSAVMAGTLFDSERESVLIALLKDVAEQPERVVVLEHLEMALIDAPRGHLLLGQALDAGARIVGTTLPIHLSRLEVAPLTRRLRVTELNEMSLRESREVLRALREQIADHHHLAIEECLLNTVIETAVRLSGYFPAKAIGLLDAAAARAVLAGERELSMFDIYTAAARVRGDDA